MSMFSCRIALFTLVYIATGPAQQITPSWRILKGHDAAIEEVPYQLNMEMYENGAWVNICGGVIIGEDVALTAGHCVISSKENLRFLSGDQKLDSGVPHEIKHIKLHENYTVLGITILHDIALIHVTPPFEHSESTMAIQLSNISPKAGDVATISGWGIIKENTGMKSRILQKINVHIVNHFACTKYYEGSQIIVTYDMICAGEVEGGKDACNGDSGGPLVVDGKLAGLVSMGLGCGQPGQPGVYTSIVKYKRWVENSIEAFRNGLESTYPVKHYEHQDDCLPQ